ncbi:hypothetical protein BV898_15930, partial [Hypsibius exemplaris]
RATSSADDNDLVNQRWRVECWLVHADYGDAYQEPSGITCAANNRHLHDTANWEPNTFRLTSTMPNNNSAPQLGRLPRDVQMFNGTGELADLKHYVKNGEWDCQSITGRSGTVHYYDSGYPAHSIPSCDFKIIVRGRLLYFMFTM